VLRLIGFPVRCAPGVTVGQGCRLRGCCVSAMSSQAIALISAWSRGENTALRPRPEASVTASLPSPTAGGHRRTDVRQTYALAASSCPNGEPRGAARPVGNVGPIDETRSSAEPQRRPAAKSLQEKRGQNVDAGPGMRRLLSRNNVSFLTVEHSDHMQPGHHL